MSELPKGWVLATLNQVGEIITGNTPSTSNSENYGGIIPFIKPPMLKNNIIRNSQEKITEQGSRNARVLPPETVLVSCIGNLGKVAITAVPSATNQQINAVVFSKGILPYYGFYYCQTLEKWLIAESSATTIAIINKTKFGNAPILVPPLNEQNRIVAKLEELFSDLEEGVSELKTAQAKLKQYRQSLLKAAVTGELSRDWRESRHANDSDETGEQLLERILVERRKRWEEKQLAKFAEQGKQPPKDWQKKYPEPVQPDTSNLPKLPDGWVWASLDMLAYPIRNGVSPKPNTEKLGYPILRISAVRSMLVNLEEIRHLEISDEQAKEFVLNNGDILITRYNGSIDLLGVFGVVRGIKESFIHPDKLIKAQPVLEQPLSDWIEISANTHHSRKYVVSKTKTTSGQTGVSGEDIKKTPIPLPPLAEQSKVCTSIFEFIQAVEKKEEVIEKTIAQSAAQRKNILRAAFAGELVPQDPNDEPASELLARIQAERQAQISASKNSTPKTRKAASKQQGQLPLEG